MTTPTGRKPGFNASSEGFQTAYPVVPPAPTPSPLIERNLDTAEVAVSPSQAIEATYEKFKTIVPELTEEQQDALLDNIANDTDTTVVTTGLNPSSRRRYPFQKYSSFKPEILNLVDELFKARPSSLTQEARAELYQKWVNDASEVYGLSQAPEIVWGPTGDSAYNQEANWLMLNSEKPYINKLLKGFRIAQLALGNATTLPSITEREYTREEYTDITCECGALDNEAYGDSVGAQCYECNTPVQERFNEALLPGNVRARNYNLDAKCWSESLYYKSRPVLFEKQARAGGLGRGAKYYFAPIESEEDDSTL